MLGWAPGPAPAPAPGAGRVNVDGERVDAGGGRVEGEAEAQGGGEAGHRALPGITLDPGPWMKTNQIMNAPPQIAAVIANTRPSAPVR